MKAKWFILYAVMVTGLGSCIGEDPANTRLNDEVKLIDDYLMNTGVTDRILYINNYGIRIHIHEYGEQAPPHDAQEVTINYVGKRFSDGVTFASGVFTDKVQNLTPLGFEATVRNIMTGSNVTAYIPSSSGYGPAGTTGVPPDEILIYDIFFANTERTPTEQAQFVNDSTAIADYIDENQLNMAYYVGDIWYAIDEPGTGDNALPYDVATIDYKLSLLSDPGTVVDEGTLNETSIFGLIDGFKVAVPLFNEGTKARFIIPSILGYGQTGFQNIPSNANLIYEITLTTIHK
jgi:FKBP-type peptidyl-prolyl cis-trans isomerase